MTKQRDSITEYMRRIDDLMQELADREERDLLNRLRALPATDEEITGLRSAMRADLEQKGMTIAEAHAETDRRLRFGLDHDWFLPGLDVRDD
jgi:hypothetical protein